MPQTFWHARIKPVWCRLRDRLVYHPTLNRLRQQRARRTRCRAIRARMARLDDVHRRHTERMHGRERRELDHYYALQFNELHGELRTIERLDEMEQLYRHLERLALDVPADWYYERDNPYAMNLASRRKLRRLISEARFRYWSERAHLIITILSLLVALAAIWVRG